MKPVYIAGFVALWLAGVVFLCLFFDAVKERR